MQIAILVVGIGILAVIAYGDVCTRRIPNALSLAIAILGLIRLVLVCDPVAAGHTLVAGTAIFGATFLLFRQGAIGGGDAKLIVAMALLVGARDLLSFLLLMSLCGGALTLAILARDKLCPRLRRVLRPVRMRSAAEVTESSAMAPRSTVPYGVAIAAAGVITLILKTPLTR